MPQGPGVPAAGRQKPDSTPSRRPRGPRRVRRAIQAFESAAPAPVPGVKGVRAPAPPRAPSRARAIRGGRAGFAASRNFRRGAGLGAGLGHRPEKAAARAGHRPAHARQNPPPPPRAIAAQAWRSAKPASSAPRDHQTRRRRPGPAAKAASPRFAEHRLKGLPGAAAAPGRGRIGPAGGAPEGAASKTLQGSFTWN